MHGDLQLSEDSQPHLASTITTSGRTRTVCTWQTLGIPVIPLMLPDPTAVHQFQSLQVRKADFKYQRTLDTTPAPMFCSAPASAMMVRETSQPSTCDTHSQPSWVLGCCTLSQQCIAGSHNATCKPNLQRLLRPQRAHGAPLAEWPLLHSGRALTASMASRWACLHDGPLVVVAPLQAGHLLLHDADALPQLLHLLLQRQVLHRAPPHMSAGHGHRPSHMSAGHPRLCASCSAARKNWVDSL